MSRYTGNLRNISYKNAPISNLSYDRIDKTNFLSSSIQSNCPEKFDLMRIISSLYLSNQTLECSNNDFHSENENRDCLSTIKIVDENSTNKFISCVVDDVETRNSSDISIREADRYFLLQNMVKQYDPVTNSDNNIGIIWKETTLPQQIKEPTTCANSLVAMTEPFRPVPTCIRETLAKYLPYLSRENILTSSTTENELRDLSLGYPILPTSVLYSAAKRIKLTDSLNDSADESFGPIINSCHPKVQAVECTLARHVEGLIDSILDIIFHVDITLLSGSENYDWKRILSILQHLEDNNVEKNLNFYQSNLKLPKLYVNHRVIQRTRKRTLSLFTNNNSYKPLDKEIPNFIIK